MAAEKEAVAGLPEDLRRLQDGAVINRLVERADGIERQGMGKAEITGNDLEGSVFQIAIDAFPITAAPVRC